MFRIYSKLKQVSKEVRDAFPDVLSPDTEAQSLPFHCKKNAT